MFIIKVEGETYMSRLPPFLLFATLFIVSWNLISLNGTLFVNGPKLTKFQELKGIGYGESISMKEALRKLSPETIEMGYLKTNVLSIPIGIKQA